MGAFYWERHPRGPFATLIAVAATYCHPKAYLGEPVSPARRADDPPRSRPGSRQRATAGRSAQMTHLGGTRS